MTRSLRRRRRTSAEQWLELAWAVPNVIAHRVGGSDRREQARMVSEKAFAAMESWSALAAYAFAFQQTLVREMFRHRNGSGLASGIPLRTWATLMLRAERGLASAMSPYHRRATANARRLGRRSTSRRR